MAISTRSLGQLYQPRLEVADPHPRITSAIVTCMDPRLRPEQSLGHAPGDDYVIRNAGGRVTGDTIRSLALACLAGPVRSVAVIHHTNCALAGTSDAEVRQRLASALGVDASDIEFLGFEQLTQSVVADMAQLSGSSALPRSLEVRGYVVDTDTGVLSPVSIGRQGLHPGPGAGWRPPPPTAIWVAART
jgi:carbonic anhydrase